MTVYINMNDGDSDAMDKFSPPTVQLWRGQVQEEELVLDRLRSMRACEASAVQTVRLSLQAPAPQCRTFARSVGRSWSHTVTERAVRRKATPRFLEIF